MLLPTACQCFFSEDRLLKLMHSKLITVIIMFTFHLIFTNSFLWQVYLSFHFCYFWGDWNGYISVRLGNKNLLALFTVDLQPASFIERFDILLSEDIRQWTFSSVSHTHNSLQKWTHCLRGTDSDQWVSYPFIRLWNSNSLFSSADFNSNVSIAAKPWFEGAYGVIPAI